jgi:hypothetical protein
MASDCSDRKDRQQNRGRSRFKPPMGFAVHISLLLPDSTTITGHCAARRAAEAGFSSLAYSKSRKCLSILFFL